MIRIEIPGRIVAKQSVRFTRAGHRYQPDEVVNYHALIATLGIEAMNGQPPIDGAVDVEITVMLSKPRSWSQRRKERFEHCTTKPDLDNACKAVLDGLKGIVLADDKNVTDLRCRKRYGPLDKVIVTVEAA